MEKILKKLGKWMDRGIVHKTVETINTDPEAGWLFITTVLLLGGFGIGLCLAWFYLMLKDGMPVWAIVFDSAIVIFCGWAVIKGIIPLAKDAYKSIRERKEKENGDQH